MTTFLFTLLFIGSAMAAMAVGVILSDRQLQGSCGGLGGKDCVCDPEDQKVCKKEKGPAIGVQSGELRLDSERA